MSQDPGEVTPRNFWLNVADGALFPAGYAFMSPATLLPLFVVSMTPSHLAIGVANAILMVGLAATQLLSAAWTLRVRNFWRWFLLSNSLCRFAIVPLIATCFLPMPWRLAAFFPALLLYATTYGLASPTWGEFIGRLIPADRRGAFFGWRGSLQGPASVVATLGSTWLLAGLPAPWSFAACFGAALLLMSLSMGCMAATRAPWQSVDEPSSAGSPFWRTLPAKLAARPALLRYSACRLVLACGAAGTSFYVVGGQERFGLDASHANLLGLALLVLPTLTGVWWGRLGDRKGPRAQLVAASVPGTVSNALIVGTHSLPLYVVGLVLVGVTQGLLTMADYAFVYEHCPTERATFFGAFNVLLLPATLGVPLLAGSVADLSGVGAVFALSAAAWLAGGVALWLGWPRPRAMAGVA